MTPKAVADALRRRVRGEARLEEILDAAVAELGAVGYDRMTMDAVARRAGASKATLYRHWPGKADLVVDALRHMRGDVDDVPDTGTLRGDLLSLVSHLCSPVTDDQLAATRGLISACAHDQDLGEVFQERLVQRKRARVLAVLERGQQRGEVSERADIHLLVDVVPAMLLYRHLFTTHDVDAAYATRLVDDVWLPLLTRTAA